MPDGYIGGKPDPSWWVTQIRAGEEHRKKMAHEHLWERWRAYYRGNFANNVMPSSAFFTMLRQVVPRTYFRDPKISVYPTIPGHMNMAFALVVGRIDNKMIAQMKMKRQMKKIITNAALFGTGIGKMGFGAKFAPVPNRIGDNVAPTPKDNLVEYDPFVVANQPWFRSVHTKNFIVAAGLEDYQDARWVGERIIRPREDVIADPRFKRIKDGGLPSRKTTARGKFSVEQKIDMLELYEIRDMKTGKVFVLAPHVEENAQILLVQDDIPREGIGFNYFPVQFNPDDEFFWAVPDAKHLEYLQMELTEVNTQIMKQRRLALTKWISKRGVISQDEKQRLFAEDAQAWVETVEDPSQILQVNVSNSDTLNQLIINRNTIIEQIRELMGFSRNQMGDFQSRRGDTSATEAAAVEAGGEVRVDEKRDALADMMVDATEHMNATMFDHWDQEKVVQVVGPGGGEVWVKFEPELLKAGRYSVGIDPDSMAPKTRAQRAQTALQIYQLMQANPLVDPVKLMRFVLTELGSVELDDIMHAMPPITSDIPTQQSPMGAGDLAGLVNRGTQQMQQGQTNPALKLLQGGG